MPASKQRYGYEKTDEAARVRSLLEMFEGPMGKRKKKKIQTVMAQTTFGNRKWDKKGERQCITLPEHWIRC